MGASDDHINRERRRLHDEISSLEELLQSNPIDRLRIVRKLNEKKDDLEEWDQESKLRFRTDPFGDS